MSSTKVYRSPKTLTFTPFPFCSKWNETGPRVRVCYSFCQFLGSIFLEPCQESNYSLLKNCNATHVWLCDDGCRCVSNVKKHCWMYTWWIIAINVKYASAAKDGPVSFSFITVCWNWIALKPHQPPTNAAQWCSLLYHRVTWLLSPSNCRPLAAVSVYSWLILFMGQLISKYMWFCRGKKSGEFISKVFFFFFCCLIVGKA